MSVINRRAESLDFERGREAAQRLWKLGLEATQIDDPLTPDFAQGALDELDLLQQGTPGILREVLEGAQSSAEQLHVESFHGLIEVVQNADDVGAHEVRIAIRKNRRHSTLLIAHDGDRVRLEHVIAMTLAFVSTKRDDPRAKGRFGIGLKTLGRLGKCLTVHCAPYHFAIEGNRVRPSKPARSIAGFHDPRSTDTLLELHLRPEFDIDEFCSWFSMLGAQALVFLDKVRSLRLFDIRRRKTVAHHRLTVLPTQVVTLPGLKEPCRCTTLKVPRTGRYWSRYEIDKKVPPNLKRLHKAMGETTPIGVALPGRPDDRGKLCAGLPLGIPTQLPISLNAQFDMDTARGAIQHVKLNEWLLGRITEVVTAVALDRLHKDPTEAWKAIPLRQEQTVPDDDWLSERITELVETIQARVRRRFNITIAGEQRRLREIAYEAVPLEGLIGQREVTGLRPKLWLLPKNTRDKEGRWRAILAELGGATLIDVEEATRLFDWEDDDLGQRDVRWFIKLARAALDEDLGEQLWYRRSVLTADDRRIVPPTPHVEGQLLLRSARPDSLASRLGLAHAVHPAYLSRWSDAVVVRKWLEENKMLHDAPDAESTLRALAAQEEGSEPITLDDDELRVLRDTFEEVTPEVAEELGPTVGRAIAFDVQQWKENKRVPATARPYDAYLPASIEDRKDGWSKAAARTPGINWVHPRYEEVLRRAGRRRRKRGERNTLAARALFRLLGAAAAPRLVEPDYYETRFDDPASPIDVLQLSLSQREALVELKRHATHLKDDRLSPDLAAVLRDLRRVRKLRQRRDRVRALLSTLEREWTGLYADHVTAEAVYSQNTWHRAGTIPTSWIGRAMDEPWLTNEAGKPTPPRNLAVRTPATEAIFGDYRELYARELDESDSFSPLVRALRVTTDPEVSELVEQLGELRQSGDVPDNRPLELRYAAIAAACKKREPSPDDKVGDLTVRQLRARFGTQRTKPGLIYANDQWLPPSRVYLGARIFGIRHAFVSEKSAPIRLWQTLRIAPPTMVDCIEVLGEVAGGAKESLDEETLVNTYLYLEERLKDATARDRRRLRSLPLWTGTDWKTSRPVYVTDVAEVAMALSNRISVWQLPVAATVVPKLIEATGVTVLNATSFDTIVHQNAFLTGATLERQFKSAVELLQDWLARHDRRLARAHSVPWEALAKPRIACDPDLQLELRIDRRSPIAVRARAHVSHDPLTFYFADADAVGEDDAGGQMLASLFTAGDRDKLALAWGRCWAKAGRGERGAVALAEDTGDETSLKALFEQASRTKPLKRSSRPAKRATRKKDSLSATAELPVRRLKTLDQLSGKTVDLVGADATDPSPKGRRRGLGRKLPPGKRIGKRGKPAPRSAPLDYSDKEKEDLAVVVLHLAINGEATELRDYRHLRGVGADALDKVGRSFEIKAHYGAMPDEVTLTGAEAERAFVKREKFFLAVISGLEEGYETIVKIIPNPLRNLDFKPSTSVTLAGITRRKSAIEVRFPDTTLDGLNV